MFDLIIKYQEPPMTTKQIDFFNRADHDTKIHRKETKTPSLPRASLFRSIKCIEYYLLLNCFFTKFRSSETNPFPYFC